jgi:hypothetical protein
MWADKVDDNDERCRWKTTRWTTTMMEEDETRWTMMMTLILVRVSI